MACLCMEVGYGRDERPHDLLLSCALSKVAALGAKQPMYIPCCALLQSSTKAHGPWQHHSSCHADQT